MIRRTEWGTRVVAAILGMLLAVFAGQAALMRLGKSLVTASYDIPFRLTHRAESGNQVRIVYLNQVAGDSLDRRPQAKILDKLGEAGAKAVVYDLIFDQPSEDGRVDEEFANAIRRFRGVDGAGNPIQGSTRRHVFLACGRKNLNMTGVIGEQLIPPIDVLLDAADDFGIVPFEHDAYRIRKLSTGNADEASITWKAAAALGAPLAEKDRVRERWLNYLGPPQSSEDKSSPPIPNFTANEVLADGFNSDLVRGKVVVIGGEPGIVGTALGKDLFSTPYHFGIGDKLPLMSGVEIQATALSNLLGGNWLTRTGDSFNLTLVIITGCLAGAGFTFFRPLHAVILAVALVIAFAVAGVGTMSSWHLWFPWTVPAFAQVPVALVWGVAAHSYVERFFRLKLSAEQKAIRAAFAKYLSPQMLDRLTLEGFSTNLGGEKAEVAMMFTDLESFTDMCERVGKPERIVETLNDYFERTTGSIFDCDGIVIKFIGDAIFAAWGAPIPDPDAPLKAVRAAWKLYQTDKLVVDGVELRTRIGIHFGEVVAGNIGSTRRVDYTMIGDAVNLAARLEGLNKMFETSILMSGAVHARLNGEFRTRRVGTFQVKGKKEAVVVHELLGPALQDLEPGWITLYHQALEALDGNQPQKALQIFSAVEASREPRGDGPSRFYIKLITAGEPLSDGVYEMKEK